MALAALVFAGLPFLTVETAPVGLLPTISADLHVSLSAMGLLVTWYALAVASIPLTRLVGAVPRRYLPSGLLQHARHVRSARESGIRKAEGLKAGDIARPTVELIDH